VSDPREVYLARLEQRRALLAALERRHRWLGPARLATFLLMAAGAWLVATGSSLPAGVLVVPAAVFAALVMLHARARIATARAHRGAEFYRRGLARLDDAWAGGGPTGEAWAESGHPFAADLDLFGPGSLFELLCEARTTVGERTLAAWLQQPAEPAIIAARGDGASSFTRGGMKFQTDGGMGFQLDP